MWVARGFAVGGVAPLLVYGVGRAMTDATAWSQYLWWVPALWSVGAAWACWAISALAGRAALRPGGVMVRPLLLVGCVIASLWLVFGEWGVHRAVLGPREQARERTLRVMHWNQSGGYRMDDSAALVAQADADIVVIVNARYDRFRRETVGAMAALVPGETEVRLDGRVAARTRAGHFFSMGMVMIGSRERILRGGMVPLPPMEATDEGWRTAEDPGFVAWFEIEPGERFASLGRPLVVWAVDFPSDPSLWRRDVVANAVEAVGAWYRQAFSCDEQGRWRAEETPVSVPAPDIVIGDFNTLRGSASLEGLAAGTDDAFGQAGWGRARSWRQEHRHPVVNGLLGLADWHIDLTRVGPAWRATRYRLVTPGSGPHKAQVVDLVLRE